MKFRQYNSTSTTTKPLVEGVCFTRENLGMKGHIRVHAHSAKRKDGTWNVSLWDERDGRHFSQIMNKEELHEAYRNDGVELVDTPWVVTKCGMFESLMDDFEDE